MPPMPEPILTVGTILRLTWIWIPGSPRRGAPDTFLV
jgi:hypothetical protein